MNCTPLSKHLLFQSRSFSQLLLSAFYILFLYPNETESNNYNLSHYQNFPIQYRFSNKIIAHSLYIVTMIHISQIINFFKSFFPQSIHNIRSCIPGFTRNVVNYFPQQCLYFFPLPHGHGSFRPIFFFVT